MNLPGPTFHPFSPHSCALRSALHPRWLSLRARVPARRFRGVPPFARDAELPAETGTGFRALHQLERAGLVRQVVPLVPVEGDRPSLRAAGALGRVAASLPESSGGNPLEGGSLIELASEQDVEWLRRRLAADPDVEAVGRLPLRTPAISVRLMAMRPPTANLWNLAAIEWAEARLASGFVDAWERKVAVIDSGIDPHHPDLAARVARSVHDYPHPVHPIAFQPEDILGHGTHVAGTIAGAAQQGFGIDGLCCAEIHAYKVVRDRADVLVEDGGRPFLTYGVDPQAYLLALADCLRAEIDVVNLSLTGPELPDPNERALLEALLARGTTLIAAMGNEGRNGNAVSYPAAWPGVIAVGASRKDDRIADFSSRGGHISLCAPGAAIWSTLPSYPGRFGYQALVVAGGEVRSGSPLERETDYDAWDGTSMAAAHVSGAAALLLANRGDLSPAEVQRWLQASADRVPGMGGRPFDGAYGHGRLNLRSLLK